MFALRELHFTRLSLLQVFFSTFKFIIESIFLRVQAEQRAGRVGLAEYSVKNRDSLEILKRIEAQKKIISFVNE